MTSLDENVNRILQARGEREARENRENRDNRGNRESRENQENRAFGKVGEFLNLVKS